MKLTIRTLKPQAPIVLEVDTEKTVKELKEQIEKELGKDDYPCEFQKLIYNGKILVDENKLTEYNFDEKKFVVLMITRPPPPPKSSATATTSSSTTSATNTSSSSAAHGAGKQQSSTKKDEPTGAKAKEDPAKPPPAHPSAPETTVSSTPSTASQASNAPSSIPTSGATTGQQRQTSDSRAAIRASGGADASSLPLNLMAQPHFRQIQDLIQQSPHLLSSTIETLAATNPEMYEFIAENPDLFMDALNQPPRSQGRAADEHRHQESRAQNPSDRQQAPMEHVINVSEHDKEAIERLKELGFSEFQAVQAYMACDKDEQLAANLLFQMD